MLEGQTAIVTGGGRGIGRATAQRLSALGARVALAARSVEELNETHRLIAAAGGEAIAIPTDVSSESEVNTLFAETHGRLGRIDILINNAGVAPSGTIESMDLKTFDAMVAVNIRGVQLCCRVAALDPFPGLGAYGATKSFVNLYTQALAAEGEPLGIRVHGIAPGAVDTRMLRGLYPDFPSDQALMPEDIAAAVERMLMPAAAALRGQTIVVKK